MGSGQIWWPQVATSKWWEMDWGNYPTIPIAGLEASEPMSMGLSQQALDCLDCFVGFVPVQCAIWSMVYKLNEYKSDGGYIKKSSQGVPPWMEYKTCPDRPDRPAGINKPWKG